MALQPLAKKHAIGELLGCLRGPHAGAPWLGVEQEGAPQGLGARQSGEVAQLSLTGRPQNRWEVLVLSNQPGGGLISTKTSSWSCNKNEEHQGLGVATALNPRLLMPEAAWGPSGHWAIFLGPVPFRGRNNTSHSLPVTLVSAMTWCTEIKKKKEE